MILRLGTLARELATAQAQAAGDAIRDAGHALGYEIDIEIVTVAGGASSRPRGPILVTALRYALLSGDVDVVAYAPTDAIGAEDLGTVTAAFLPRADAREALCAQGSSLDELAPGARIGASNDFQAAQLRALRDDLEIVDAWEPPYKRLARLGEDVDALLMSRAELSWVGRDDAVDQTFELEAFIPRAGQGAIAVDVRRDSPALLLDVLASCDDPDSRAAIDAEAAALAVLERGCTVPVGAHATVSGTSVEVLARATSPSGRLAQNEAGRGPAQEAAAVGRATAHALLARDTNRLARI